MADEKVVSKKLLIRRIYPDELATHFVVHMVVQQESDFFTLSFFEVWKPAILGDTEEERKRLIDELKEIEAKCVARLVVTPQKMKEFVQVISESLRKYEIKVETKEKKD